MTTAMPCHTEPCVSESVADQLFELGADLNANQYQAVHLAARYDEQLEWLHRGHSNAAAGIADRLQIHPSTAREWIRVGYLLRELSLIDEAFRTNDISYAKARILTRWADVDNQQQLLDLAATRNASRLTTAIAKALAEHDPDDTARDQRHHDARSLTSYTDGDGMVVIRIVLSPALAKLVLAAIRELVRLIAATPLGEEPPLDASADAPSPQTVNQSDSATTESGKHASVDASQPIATELGETLREMRRRWQPDEGDDWIIPTMAQQQADAFVALLLQRDIALTTEVVIHLRGDGNTFDDGTPVTTNAIARQLDDAFIRLLIHDVRGNPINASSRRRHPTTRQKRVVMEAHNHECVDCQATSLLELDHNPPYHRTRHTITTELEPRCAPCHRTRHRIEQSS